MGYNSVPLRPPCSNRHINCVATGDGQDAGRPLYVLVRSLDPRDISDYWVNINKATLEAETVFHYFQGRAMEAEEDEDLLDVLPNEKLYMLELPATISHTAFMQLVKYPTEQTNHFDCMSKAAKFMCTYGQLLKVYNFLDYCDVPEL